ncbi:MAG: TlyA family RNA methyltransferase [Desulfobacterales bacterium]
MPYVERLAKRYNAVDGDFLRRHRHWYPFLSAMTSSKKNRLDLVLVEKGLTHNRQRARALIMAGKVLVNDLPAEKPGAQISPKDDIRLRGDDIPYVGRGGVKLASVLETLNIAVEGSDCLDVGASTGGFTDCLLQHGANRVFAVDVGYGQLAWRLQQDPRVISIERSNIRYLETSALPCPVDLITIDVSFISLKIVVPAVLKFMKGDASILALVKPQFEVGRGHIGKGGIVRDPSLHETVLADLTDAFSEAALFREGMAPSPILGAKGNREFFMLLRRLKSGSEE